MPSLPSASPTPAAAVAFWRDPALPFFEGRQASGSVSCYTPHTHPTFSIGIVDAGNSTFSLPQRQTRIVPGDVVLIAADEVHACNPAMQAGWSYRMFHIDQAWLRQLLAEAGLDAGQMRVSRVLHCSRAGALMDAISAAMRSDDTLRKETAVIASLCELFASCQPDCTDAADASTDCADCADCADIAALQVARDHLRDHCCDKIGLDTLAQLAGVGRYQLIRLFTRHFGMTPHALQLDMRINLARDFLRRGLSLADVAHRTGFADQSHFHRIFKSRVAATPAQYQYAR